MTSRPISLDITPSVPGSPVATGEESIVMELPCSGWESDEDTELHEPTDVASSPLSSTPGRDEESGAEEDG